MGDIKALKKENDKLKKQISQLSKDFKIMQDKMAEKRAPPNTSNMPNENDIQFLSNGYDDLVKSKVDTQNDVLNLKKRLDLLSVGVNRIDKAIDDLLIYSYQYNLKIVGVPQLDDKESSDETAVLCINLFRAMGVDISISDIDIAHRYSKSN